MKIGQLKKIHMGKATCALDLGDGSERGEYVNQDYILSRLGRPHRAISLMYCYYPLDEGFPGRASVVHKSPDVNFAWGYPYDDYFPYCGGLIGDKESSVFQQMKDIRRHGQDVLLTLTIDPHVSDEHLRAIGRDLRPYGRVLLRINHEATGNWFSFNKRCSYQEVADFFVRASRVIKEEAPNVQTIICIGGIESLDAKEMVMEKEFLETVFAADIWSVDKYMALHWGWPYDVAEPGGTTHKRDSVDFIYETTKRSLKRFTELNGGEPKPIVMSEFNADGDVTGPYDQCRMVKEFTDKLKKDEPWLSAISMYQFRDRGRLGLEIEDPSNANVGIEQPLCETYRDILSDSFFSPKMTIMEEAKLPVTLRWGGAEDAEGVAIPVELSDNPHFCELSFEGKSIEANLMLCFHGRWFYKAPGVSFVDLMPAFFKNPLTEATNLQLQIFAPPASGENDASQGEDWDVNFYSTLWELPKIRVLYGPVK